MRDGLDRDPETLAMGGRTGAGLAKTLLLLGAGLALLTSGALFLKGAHDRAIVLGVWAPSLLGWALLLREGGD